MLPCHQKLLIIFVHFLCEPLLGPQHKTTTNWKSLLRAWFIRENLVQGERILTGRKQSSFLFSFLTVDCKKFDDICLGIHRRNEKIFVITNFNLWFSTLVIGEYGRVKTRFLRVY